MYTISVSDILKDKFIGADDLRRKLSDILDALPKETKLVITQHGKPKAVLLDLNTYLQIIDLQEDVLQPGYINLLYKELERVKQGKGITHSELVKKLRV